MMTAAAMANAGDGAGEPTRGMFVCMLRVVGSYTKINSKWFRKKSSHFPMHLALLSLNCFNKSSDI
jgi:hypothetical protein